MNDNFICPFCNANIPMIDETYRHQDISFETINYRANYSDNELYDELKLQMFKCPTCKEITVKTLGIGSKYPDVSTNIYPKSLAKQFPDYIPQQIRKDYEEACAILNLSPKASATLSWRTLQGMIRDFWGISKNFLWQEIDAIENKISPLEKSALDSLRGIGNIGAHPEHDTNLIVDIEPGESEKIVKLIEYFIQRWYIDPYETEQLLHGVNATNINLQDQRKNGK